MNKVKIPHIVIVAIGFIHEQFEEISFDKLGIKVNTEEVQQIRFYNSISNGLLATLSTSMYLCHTERLVYNRQNECRNVKLDRMLQYTSFVITR